jgi:cob(I)alamin adenosyltransferase
MAERPNVFSDIATFLHGARTPSRRAEARRDDA